MRVISVNSANSVYSKIYAKMNQQKTITRPMKNEPLITDTVSFKGDNGAVLGIIGGAALGALAAAVIVATGGLAASVASVGLGGVMTAGAASGTHLGGIAGSIIEDKLENSK